jgi:hypothetical protein
MVEKVGRKDEPRFPACFGVSEIGFWGEGAPLGYLVGVDAAG